MLALQIVRNPEKIEPPDRVNHEFSGGKRPGLFERQQLRPFDFPRRSSRIALNILKLAVRAVAMLFGPSVEQQPQNQPCEAESPCEQESPPPTQMHRNPRHDQRGNDRANVRARVENPRRQRPFFLWKPFRDALDTRGENTGFAES